MATKNYERQPGGFMLDFKGMNTIMPVDKMPPGKYPYAQNVRAYLREAITGRTVLGGTLFTATPSLPVLSLIRMNDSTVAPFGPSSGYMLLAVGSGRAYAYNLS